VIFIIHQLLFLYLVTKLIIIIFLITIIMILRNIQYFIKVQSLLILLLLG